MDAALSLVPTVRGDRARPAAGIHTQHPTDRRVSMRRSITSTTTSRPGTDQDALGCYHRGPGERSQKECSLLGEAPERIVAAPLLWDPTRSTRGPWCITLCRPYIMMTTSWPVASTAMPTRTPKGSPAVLSGGYRRGRCVPLLGSTRIPLLIEHHELTRGLNGKARQGAEGGLTTRSGTERISPHGIQRT